MKGCTCYVFNVENMVTSQKVVQSKWGLKTSKIVETRMSLLEVIAQRIKMGNKGTSKAHEQLSKRLGVE